VDEYYIFLFDIFYFLQLVIVLQIYYSSRPRIIYYKKTKKIARKIILELYASFFFALKLKHKIQLFSSL